MIGERVGQVVEWVHPGDRELPAHEQTVFLLRTLSAKTMMAIMDVGIRLGENGMPALGSLGTAAYQACKHGIAGWRNLRDREGNEIPCRTQRLGRESVVSDDSLDCIRSVVQDVGAAIFNLNMLDGADRGNSPSSPIAHPGPGLDGLGARAISGSGGIPAQPAGASQPSPAVPLAPSAAAGAP